MDRGTEAERPQADEPQRDSRVRAHPASLLRVLRAGRLEATVPLVPGSLMPGVTVKDGTVMRVAVEARDGEVDFDAAELQFAPPIDGPLFTQITGAYVGADSRIAIRISGFPDVKVGPVLPSRLTELAELLEDHHGSWLLPVRLLQIPIAAVRVGGSSSSTTLDQLEHGAERGKAGSPRLDRARLRLSDAELDSGTIDLGPAGSVRLSGGQLEVDGTGRALRWTGRLEVDSLDLALEDASVRELRGTFDLTGDYERPVDAPAQVQLSLENVEGQFGPARWRRDNGDQLRISEGEGHRGKVQLVQQFEGRDELLGARVGPPLIDASFEEARATLESGTVTLKAGIGTVKAELRRNTYRGSVRYNRGRVRGEGDGQLEGTVHDFETHDAAMSLKARVAHLEGDAHLRFDSARGVQLTGSDLRVRAEIERAAISGWDGRIAGGVAPGSLVNAKLRKLEVSKSGRVKLEAENELSLVLTGFGAKAPHASAESAQATVKIRGDARLDTAEGLEILSGRLQLDANDVTGRVQLHGVHAEGRGKLHFVAELGTVSLRRDLLSLETARTSALAVTLASATAHLPDGGRIELSMEGDSEAKADFELLRLSDPGGAELRASLQLRARFAAPDDLAAVLKLARLHVQDIDGGAQGLELSVGRVVLERDDGWEVEDLRLATDLRIRRAVGSLKPRG